MQPRSLHVLATVPSLLLSLLLLVLLAGCNPTYNWRDVAAPDASWRALFPAKPATLTRDVDLDGLRVAMTMTAAEVEGATFAVGTAELADAARAPAAIAAMWLALARNIGAAPQAIPDHAAAIDVSGVRNGTPLRLAGRFEARGKRVYQVIVVGPAAAMPAEQVEQFLTSFTPR
jgi:hypothetical protein